MTSQPRPVWLTAREAAIDPELYRRYHAAPADAAEAVAKAIRDYWGYENSCSDERYVPLVLLALGYPHTEQA